MGHALRQTVLVVEGDQLQRELVTVIFEESDMHVIACMSAEAAAAVLDKSIMTTSHFIVRSSSPR